MTRGSEGGKKGVRGGQRGVRRRAPDAGELTAQEVSSQLRKGVYTSAVADRRSSLDSRFADRCGHDGTRSAHKVHTWCTCDEKCGNRTTRTARKTYRRTHRRPIRIRYV
eukprot:91466-Prorocentrum_minimum.AAC.1